MCYNANEIERCIMIELYNRADPDNITRTKFGFAIYDKDNCIVIEFVQSEYSDLNKWGKQKVLTDLVITKFLLPEIYGHISSKGKLKKYITENFNEDLEVVETIGNMAKTKQKVEISLPTSVVPHLRGIPTSLRRVKNTHLPLIVKVNEKDVSSAFMDFGDFEENTVEAAYQALMKGNIPTSKNDLFYVEGVNSLHNELSAEM